MGGKRGINKMKDNEQNDNELEILVMLIQCINFDLFERLMKRCKPTISSLTNKFFLENYSRDDLIQEARRVLVIAADKYDHSKGVEFSKYYYMQLSNHFKHLLRKENAQKRIANTKTSSLDKLAESAGIHVKGTSSIMTHPEDVMLAKEAFVGYLVELSPFEKDVFLLFLSHHSPEKIAEKLGFKVKQVQTAIYRCGMKLRDALN